MTFPRSFVTIGDHHKGPHVDALYALAERCGAEVIVIKPKVPPRAPQRLRYAGFDPDDRITHAWGRGVRP